MQRSERTALRLALLIHARYRIAQRKRPLYFPESMFDTTLRLRRLAERASFLGWEHAANRLRSNLAAELDFCRTRLSEIYEVLLDQPPQAPSLPDLWHDILALKREFPSVTLCFRSGRLSVETEPVTLKNIELGPFSIQLDWRRLPASEYRVVAVEPNPARTNAAVTHPHVRSEQLCEGEGREAIQTAVQDGRLFDFFQVVSQMLHTYGQGSAYVELNVWNSAHCNGCGDWIADGGRSCAECDVPLCDRCARTCCSCGEPYCSRCLNPCCSCHEAFCDSCLETCSACDERVCSNCQTEDLCEKCYDHQDQHDDEEDAVGGNSDAEIQPDGLGQAAVSA